MMKIIFILVLGMLVAQTTHAQFMIPQTTRINTPYGSVNHTTYTYQPMRFYGSTAPTSVKYEFTIVLKDSTRLTGRTRIEFLDSVSRVVLKEKKEKRTIMPSETLELYRVDSYGNKFSGIATDSCWLFLSTKGKINTYSNLAEHNIEYMIAVQQGDGPILPITKQNLIEMVGDHKRALELIGKKKYVKAVQAYNSTAKTDNP